MPGPSHNTRPLTLTVNPFDMNRNEQITAINACVTRFFQKHPGIDNIPAKDLMEEFIAAGIFQSNHQDGLPIRSLLRDLDASNQLHLLPMLRVERMAKNRRWFFSTPRYLQSQGL